MRENALNSALSESTLHNCKLGEPDLHETGFTNRTMTENLRSCAGPPWAFCARSSGVLSKSGSGAARSDKRRIDRLLDLRAVGWEDPLLIRWNRNPWRGRRLCGPWRAMSVPVREPLASIPDEPIKANLITRSPGTEVNDVVRALRSNGIDVTAIHNHMLTEEPRIIFMHFWANDDAIKLAKALRAALDKTASSKS